jgi:hypothetical protein
MSNTETYHDSKKGRPAHTDHKCKTCNKPFNSAALLASHKSHFKRKNVSCVSVIDDGFMPP